MIFDSCPAHDGKCPCLTCEDEHCRACIGTGPGRYGVDTDRLCKIARDYCESWRDGPQLAMLFPRW